MLDETALSDFAYDSFVSFILHLLSRVLFICLHSNCCSVLLHYRILIEFTYPDSSIKILRNLYRGEIAAFALRHYFTTLLLLTFFLN